jgi:hypothetical protein
LYHNVQIHERQVRRVYITAVSLTFWRSERFANICNTLHMVVQTVNNSSTLLKSIQLVPNIHDYTYYLINHLAELLQITPKLLGLISVVKFKISLNIGYFLSCSVTYTLVNLFPIWQVLFLQKITTQFLVPVFLF